MNIANQRSPATVENHQQAFTERFDVLLDQAEVATWLRVGPKTLEAWRYRGRGPRYTKVGHLIRYTRSDIREFLESRSRASTSDVVPK